MNIRTLLILWMIPTITTIAQDKNSHIKRVAIYDSQHGKEVILDLYKEKLRSLDRPYFFKEIDTRFAKTNVTVVGDTTLPKLVLLHGINSGSSIAINPVKGLTEHYCIYAVDIPGQPTLSEEVRMPLRDGCYEAWLNEVFNKLNIDKAPVIAFSYGGFLLQRLMVAHPEKVEQAIFIVPIGITNGSLFKLVGNVLFPMLKYKRTNERDDLLKFMDALYTEKTAYYIEHQKAILEHFKMDIRQPPKVSKSELKGNDTPVYVVGAEDDIFFPGEKLIKKAKKIFPNFKYGVVLEDSKHVPQSSDYDTLQRYVLSFLNNDHELQ